MTPSTELSTASCSANKEPICQAREVQQAWLSKSSTKAGRAEPAIFIQTAGTSHTVSPCIPCKAAWAWQLGLHICQLQHCAHLSTVPQPGSCWLQVHPQAASPAGMLGPGSWQVTFATDATHCWRPLQVHEQRLLAALPALLQRAGGWPTAAIFTIAALLAGPQVKGPQATSPAELPRPGRWPAVRRLQPLAASPAGHQALAAGLCRCSDMPH